MKKLIILLALFFPTQMEGQGAPPPTSILGSIGITGGQSLTGQTNISMPDATYTMVANEWWAGTLKLTGALTAQRDLVAPANPGQHYCVENSTTGGHPVRIVAVSGVGVAVPNGQTFCVVFDGGNYVATGAPGVQFLTNNVPNPQQDSLDLVNTSGPGGISFINGSGAVVTASLNNTSMTISNVNCTLGAACAIPVSCGGITCPAGQQTAVPFTNPSALSITAPHVIGDGQLTVASTAGFPGQACGYVLNVPFFYVCWSSIDATHLFGLQFIYGGSDSAIPSAPTFQLFGWSNTLSSSVSTPYIWALDNALNLTYFPGVTVNTLTTIRSNQIQGSYSGTSIIEGLVNATSSANSNSKNFDIDGSWWNGVSPLMDTWRFVDVLGAGGSPTSTLTLSKPNTSPGASSINMPFLTNLGTGSTVNSSAICTAANAATTVGCSTPIYDTFGDLVQGHTVTFTGTTTSGQATVNFTGAAVFASSSSYACTVNSVTPPATAATPYTYSVTYTSGFQILLNASAAVTDAFRGVCVGQ